MTTTARMLSSYRAAAVRLREAAEWNRFDANFQEPVDGRKHRVGRLVPLVDANVVKFFMDPDREVHLIDSFASLQDSTPGKQAAPSHLATFARVTAEFMFLSSPITIGGDVGQLWHEVPLITPAHSEETTAMLYRIERKVYRLLDKIKSKTEAGLLMEANLLKSRGESAIRSIEELSRAGSEAHPDSSDFRMQVLNVSGSLEMLFAPIRDATLGGENTQQDESLIDEIGALEEYLRWTRLIRQTKLCPLLSHPLCNASVLQPPEEEIRRLAEPLAELKRSAGGGRNESSTQVAQRAWRDATAVVQTTMLNKLARQDPNEAAEELRFVLISGDDALHNIYAEQFWDDARQSDPRPDRYVLRRPVQYIPVMNAKDIPNGYQAKALFDTFLNVLNSVTDFVTKRTHFAYALEHDWRRQPLAPSRRSLDLEIAPLQKLADLWRQATIASNTLCGGLAVYDFGLDDLMLKLDALARDEHAVAQLASLQQQIYREIDGTQLPLIAQELLSDAVGALRRQAKATRVAGVRMPMLIREGFEDVTGNLPIERFIVKLANSREATDMAQLQNAMSRWHRIKVLFFAGAIAAVANNFQRAARYLSHAEHLLRSDHRALGEGRPPHLVEISYLRCVVDRLRMKDKRLFDDVRRRLRQLVDAAPKESFEHARALAESGSLLLMRYFNVRFDVEEDNAAEILSKLIERSKRNLDEARLVSSIVRERRTAKFELIQALDAQIHTNTIAWYVVQSRFFDGVAEPLCEPVVDSLRILENVADEAIHRDHIIGLWGRIANWLTAPSGKRSVYAADVAGYCQTRLRALSVLGDDYQAPSDAPVFSFIAKRAAAEVSA